MGGKLIVFEGTDGSGKKTQFDLLLNRLKKEKYKVKTQDFPRYDSYYGKIIARYLKGELGNVEKIDPYFISIAYALDRLEEKHKMKKWLKTNDFLLCNRYITSNKAHQTSKLKNRKEQKHFLRWIDDLEYKTNGMPRENLVIFLHVPAKIAQSLVEKKGHRKYIGKEKDMHERNIKHLKNTEKVYLELSKNKKWKTVKCVSNNKIISKKEIHEKVYDIVRNLK